MIRGYACVADGSSGEQARLSLLAAGCGRIYVEDRPFSRDGSKTRPALRLLLRDLRAGDAVVVWRLECLAKSVDRLIRIILEIRDAGASLRSLSEPWADTTGEHAEMLYACLSWFYTFSEGVLQARYEQARKAKEEQGKPFGRPPAFTDEEKAEVLGWLEAGMMMSEAARRKQVHIHTIYRLRDAAEKEGLALPKRSGRYKRSGITDRTTTT